MDAGIVLFDCSQWASREKALRGRGTEVRCLQGQDIPGLLAFLRGHTSYDWLREGRELLDDMARGLADGDQIVVALHAGEVIGYCQFRAEHFGPFGVREDMRGQGVGTVLLAKCIRTMQSKGLHNAWVLWTSDENAERVYGKFGFTETRRFAVLRRRL
jgi:GNAT superfamily N-acetyltransferase